jgi:hypothetical protein
MAFAFLLAFQVVGLFRFHIVPSLARMKDASKANNEGPFDFMQVVVPCVYAVILIFLHMFPDWYINHRETFIMMNRIFSPYHINKTWAYKFYQLADQSTLRKYTMYVAYNLFGGAERKLNSVLTRSLKPPGFVSFNS